MHICWQMLAKRLFAAFYADIAIHIQTTLRLAVLTSK
jgi:hypothetical protein